MDKGLKNVRHSAYSAIFPTTPHCSLIESLTMLLKGVVVLVPECSEMPFMSLGTIGSKKQWLSVRGTSLWQLMKRTRIQLVPLFFCGGEGTFVVPVPCTER